MEVAAVVVVPDIEGEENSTVSLSLSSKWRFDLRRDRSRPALDISKSSSLGIMEFLLSWEAGRRRVLVDTVLDYVIVLDLVNMSYGWVASVGLGGLACLTVGNGRGGKYTGCSDFLVMDLS